jgi:hypothetical protein
MDRQISVASLYCQERRTISNENVKIQILRKPKTNPGKTRKIQIQKTKSRNPRKNCNPVKPKETRSNPEKTNSSFQNLCTIENYFYSLAVQSKKDFEGCPKGQLFSFVKRAKSD